jgi:protein-tyrosine phosphatase
MSRIAAWLAAVALFTMVTGVPLVYYRYCYTHGKRLRPVEEGKVYRSGCMTADGLAHAIKSLGIRTVLNLMEEFSDPVLSTGYFDTTEVHEAELCERLGARMVNLVVDTIPPNRVASERPGGIDRFLDLMDHGENYPVLIHCRAGLHRTGIIVAVYRMEYDHWSRDEAMGELKANGFGNFAATAANDYILQYILTYEPGRRWQKSGFRGQVSGDPPRLLPDPCPLPSVP